MISDFPLLLNLYQLAEALTSTFEVTVDFQ